MSNCQYTYCSSGCCNYYGYCTENYNSATYSSYYTDCYYWYGSGGVPIGTIVGAVIGGIVFLIILIALCVHCKRKRDAQ